MTEFQQAAFQCSSNTPTASISWFFTPQGASEGASESISDQSEGYSIQTGSGTSTLIVSTAMFPQHVGEYTCNAASNGGSISASAQLDVLGMLAQD